jgi:hypothetical protein
LIGWQCASTLAYNKRLTRAAVQQFHQEFNDGEYHKIFTEADPGFTEGKTEDDLVKFLIAIHMQLGDAGAVYLTNINVNAKTNGTFTTVRCKTTFSRGSAMETFTWMKMGNTLKLYGYDIQGSPSPRSVR